METPPEQQAETQMSKEGWLVRSIKSAPEHYRFPLVLTFIILIAGSAVVLASTNEFRLAGVIVIVFGLGGGAYIYQNAQEARKTDTDGLNKTYGLTIVVLSPERQPVYHASVTVLGPVSFVNRKTKKDGRVMYQYTGHDMQTYRNRKIEIQASYDNFSAIIFYELKAQIGDIVNVELQNSQTLSNNTGVPQVTGMNREQFQQIIDLVDDFVTTTNARQALINQAFWGEKIANNIDVSGSAHDFTTHLISELYTRGGIESIIQLLDTLKEQVGTNRQHEIDELILSIKE